MDIIQLIKGGFIQGAKDESYSATALIYDVRLSISDSGQKTDAVAVSLNHRDGYSVTVLFPYTLNGREVLFGEALAQPGEADIFPGPPIH